MSENVEEPDPGRATSLVQDPAEDAQVFRIDYEGGKASFFVTQKAKKSMACSMDAMANQPTIFFKLDFIMQAVADAVEEDKIEISFPQTPEKLQEFDWNDVIIGRPETYFKQKKPEQDVFDKVHAIHTAVKAEKDEEAREMGLPKSGVQAWSTYYQRWREWRNLCAVYRSLYPNETKEMVYNRIKGQCKMMSSLDKIYTEVVSIEIKKHLDRMKREDRKRRAAEKIEAELEKTEEDKEKADAKIVEAKAKHASLKQDLKNLKKAKYAGSKAAKAKARKEDQLAKSKEIKEAKAAAAKASRVAKEKEKHANTLKRQAQEVEVAAAQEEPVKKPKLKRNDISMLNMDPIPSKRVELDGDNWKPPMRNKDKKGPVAFRKPGNKWAAESTKQILLLFAMARALTADGATQQPMTFQTFVEFVAPNCPYKFDFNGRVFIYLVALILNQKM